MIITKITRARIYPNKQQLKQINITLNCCRYIYNYMVVRNTKAYKRRKEYISKYSMQKIVTTMKNYLPWLKDADSQALNYSCVQVDNAFQNFFKKRSNYPVLHKKNKKQSYTNNHSRCMRIDGNKFKFPCIGWLKIKGLKKLPENYKICSATIIKEADNKYYISIIYKYEIEDKHPIININNVIGIDYKSDSLYVDNNGYSPKIPHWFRENQTKLVKEQRRLAKKKGSKIGEEKSNNWIKQHKKVIKLQKKIANRRRDYLQKLSTTLAQNYDAIGIEDLNLQDISRNLNLGKATMDNGFGEFRTMLNYKLKDYGKPELIKINKFYPSSQLCSCCGYKNVEIKNLSIRQWCCPQCKTIHDRDINAAINIKTEAVKILLKKCM